MMLIVAITLSISAGPALAIDAKADRHPISPLIYGMAYATEQIAKEIRLPLNRWGGDATTRYNWQIDASNSGDDWFFVTEGGPNKKPSGTPDQWVQDANGWGGKVMLTIPIIDYITKSQTLDCTFPVSIFGPQQKTNPYVHPVVNGHQTDAGNGRKPDGTIIQPTKEQILRIHRPNSPEHQGAWVQHLVGKFGKGGVPFYEMDNEPDGWNNTHRDVHPASLGDDELVNKTVAYASAVKKADPSTAIVGPGGFLLHYQNEGVPGDGKADHGGLGQATYYLRQMAAYEKRRGKRLLDYFDEHYYPIGQEGGTDATILEQTRSLWDPTYVEKDWYGKYNGPINLIPSFRKWVSESYPGTKVSISEYGMGDPKTAIGAMVQADTLGIFAREGLDMACLFGPPTAQDPMANAFRAYRNYDGKGGSFGETWVRSSSSDQSTVAVYGAERKEDGALTLIVINKSTQAQTCRLSLSHFTPKTRAELFRFSGTSAIASTGTVTVNGSGFTTVYPPRSVSVVAIPKAN